MTDAEKAEQEKEPGTGPEAGAGVAPAAEPARRSGVSCFPSLLLRSRVLSVGPLDLVPAARLADRVDCSGPGLSSHASSPVLARGMAEL